MKRRLAFALLVATLAPVAARAQEIPAGRCPWAGSWPASIGIKRLLCRGGSCEINVPESGGLAHRFSTEPVVQELSPDAPDELAEGDVIVAVDGALITTRDGGRRLARLRVGAPVTLTLRREGRPLEVRLTPVAGCPTSGLSVRVRG